MLESAGDVGNELVSGELFSTAAFNVLVDAFEVATMQSAPNSLAWVSSKLCTCSEVNPEMRFYC
ncbi:hypothetical protein NIES4075_71190 [Tolypothrix sp. NIES-4075]|nr:hypothetical protein NIES4075_71190 [Tolypothrix sp. NIES-4075]